MHLMDALSAGFSQVREASTLIRQPSIPVPFMSALLGQHLKLKYNFTTHFIHNCYQSGLDLKFEA